MKHAGPATLEQLTHLLHDLRERTPLREPRPGCFYLKSKGFLHFHEDPAGIFADVKLDSVDFTRYRVTTRKEQQALLARVDRCLRNS